MVHGNCKYFFLLGNIKNVNGKSGIDLYLTHVIE